MEPRSMRISLAIWSALVITFLWIPLVIIGLYAFNKSNIQGWPISSWTLHWFSVTWHNAEARKRSKSKWSSRLRRVSRGGEGDRNISELNGTSPRGDRRIR